MLEAIRYNLKHLLDFNGRDARSTFWYYVLFLLILNFAIGMASAIPVMVRSGGAAIVAVQAGGSEQDIQASMMGEMSAAMGGTLWVSVVTGALMAGLLLAAFVRRLHDSDKSGWWALLPLACQAFAILATIRMISVMPGLMRDMMAASGDPARLQIVIDRQSELNAYSAIAWIGPIVVIVFGVLASTPGPNPYGEAPVSIR